MANKRIKDLGTTITAFRTGDVIPVDGPSGTAKMSKDDLLKETAQNALGSIHSLSDTATEADLASGNFLALDGNAGTKKLPAGLLKDLNRVREDGLAFSIETEGDTTYKILSDVYTVLETGYYDLEYSVSPGYQIFGSGTNNVLTLCVLNGTTEVFIDVVSIYAATTRLDGVSRSSGVFIEAGWKIAIKGRISCTFNLNITKSKSSAKFAIDEIARETSDDRSLAEDMERGGIYMTSAEWTYDVPTDLPHYYSRVRSSTTKTIYLNEGDIVHSDLFGKIRAYFGCNVMTSTTLYKSGWVKNDFVAPQAGYYVFQATLVDERELTDSEVAEIINSFSVIRVNKTLAEKINNLENYVGKGYIKSSTEIFSLVGSSSYNSQLAYLGEIKESDKYDLEYSVVDFEYTRGGAGSDVELQIYAVNENQDVVWIDVVALSNVDTRLRCKNVSKNVQLNAGVKLYVGGCVTCRLEFGIRKSSSLPSTDEKLISEVFLPSKVSDNMERGGIYIQPDVWTYDVPTDLPYYYSRVRTKDNFVLYLEAGDTITSSMAGDVVFYVGWKEASSSHSEFQSGWRNSDYIVPKTAYYVFQARLAEERELTDSEVAEIINSFSVVRVNKNLAEKIAGLDLVTEDNPKVTQYSGERLPLNSIYAKYLADILMEGTTEAVNGLAIYGSTLVTTYNSGTARLYTIDKNFNITSPSSLFHLGSYDATNHANCASFGNKYSESDVLPLLYISRYNNAGLQCYVERVDKENLTSTLVQTINIASGLYGYSIDWVVDKERQKLITFGNTINSGDGSNKHRVMVFDIPSTSSSSVSLTAQDAVENYFMEDYSDEIATLVDGVAVFSVQGCFAKNGFIYCLASGSQEQELTRPKSIYCWDWVNKKLHAKVPLNGVVNGELEDLEFFNGSIVLQSGYGLNKFFRLFL